MTLQILLAHPLLTYLFIPDMNTSSNHDEKHISILNQLQAKRSMNYTLMKAGENHLNKDVVNSTWACSLNFL